MTKAPGAQWSFPVMPDQPDSPQREQAILEFWKREKIFARSLAQTKDGERYSFYEGPPTANGKPGVHHVLARSFKDLFPRFWTMRGKRVLRKAGWDTHGLPVEHEVERKLGILDKSRIVTEVGIEKFTQLCRDSVHQYVGDWNRMTERMGYWVDLDDAYFTLTNDYIESVWSLLKQLWDKGLIQQDYKSVPYDPRIGATLSDHEVAQGYREVDDPSVFVRFRLKEDPKTSFLAWTTTPWTLPANMALAVHPAVTYCTIARDDERLIVAEPLLDKVFRDETVTVERRTLGAELAGTRYVPLYDYCRDERDRYFVVAEEFVTTEDGTGVVHIAPAYGPEDLAIGKARDLPIYYSVDLTGHVVADVTVAAGQFFKDADKPIMADLKARGLMFRQETFRHTYPFGWRTNDPLLYIAKTAWFIRTTLFKQELLDLNDTINWVPDNVKYGRFGNWLENNVDWALSRERFWGTPLPVWTDGEKYICVGSVAELSGLSGRDLTAMDLHRPAIDAVTFTIDNREYARVPEVIDAWFDSGSMPYAQWHYPFEHRKEFEENFPADFICEAVDQTRGWFYSLHAIATMLFDEAAYKNVICLGHVVDANGEKMSKSKGNILDPYSIFDTLGADALRWYFFTGSAPGAVKRISTELVADGARGFINTIWNTAKFFVMYANAESVGVPEGVPFERRSDMDRWALSSLNSTIKNVTSHLEQYNAQAAGREIDAFVDGLSNWYVRLSRDRFWGTSASPDAKAAFRTLYDCLTGVTLLLAPFMPFLAESLYSYLVAPMDSDASPSVHLASWPVAGRIDDEIVAQMDIVRRAVELGRQARAAAKIKMRQPLSCAYIRASSKYSDAALRQFRALVLDELNVKDVQVVGIDASFIEYALRPNLPRLGPRFGKDLGALRKAIAAADPRAVAVAAAGGKGFEVSTDGKKFALEPEDVLVDSKSAQGFAFAEGDGMLVALDTRLDRALELEGWAREIVRAVQDARKAAGFDVSDRIALSFVAEGDQFDAAVQWKDYIVEQTLATSWSLERGAFGVSVSKLM